MSGARRDDLEIIETRTMLELPRGKDVLRLDFVRARTGGGGETAWHSLAEWYQDGPEWKRGRRGITVRGRELRQIAIALLRACASSIPLELRGSAKAIVAALSETGGRS